MIRQSGEANFRFRELTPSEASREAIEELAQEIFQRAIRSACRGRSTGSKCCGAAPDDHVLVFAIHHAIADGWTLGVFVQDLCVAYVAGAARPAMKRCPLCRKPIPRGARRSGRSGSRPNWSRGSRFGNRISRAAAGFGMRSKGRRRPSGRLERWVPIFPPNWPMPRGNWPAGTGATLFSTLLTAFQVGLSRWTGAHDILVGTPVANRTKQAARETMGYFRRHRAAARSASSASRPFSDSLRACIRRPSIALPMPCPLPNSRRRLGTRQHAGPQSRFRGAVRLAKSSGAGCGVARSFRETAHALDRHGPIPSRVRNHRGRRMASKWSGFFARNSFLKRRWRISNESFLPSCSRARAAHRESRTRRPHELKQ